MTGAIGKIYQDVLHPRRPTLNYVSPAICEAIFSGTSFATLILDALAGQSPVQGFRFVFNPLTGRFRLEWDTYSNAICYNVYLADTPGDPNTTYTLFSECNPDTFFDPPPDFPECFDCVIVTAITPDGETPFPPPTGTHPLPEPPPDGPGPGIVYFNVEYTATCPAGFTGTPVTVLAGVFSSLVSQADADGQAIAAAEFSLSCLAADFNFNNLSWEVVDGLSGLPGELMVYAGATGFSDPSHFNTQSINANPGGQAHSLGSMSYTAGVTACDMAVSVATYGVSVNNPIISVVIKADAVTILTKDLWLDTGSVTVDESTIFHFPFVAPAGTNVALTIDVHITVPNAGPFDYSQFEVYDIVLTPAA